MAYVHMRNGNVVSGGSGGGNATAGYNTDTDSLWVLKNGEKVDVLKLYSERYYLIKDGLNHGDLKLETYSGNAPTMTYSDDTMTLQLVANSSSQYPNGTLVFDEIDITNFDMLTFEHSSVTNHSSASYNSVEIGVRQLGNSVASIIYFVNTGSKAGEVVLDVSNIDGKAIIYFKFVGFYRGYGDDCYVKTTIRDMYLQ